MSLCEAFPAHNSDPKGHLQATPAVLGHHAGKTPAVPGLLHGLWPNTAWAAQTPGEQEGLQNEGSWWVGKA